MPRSLPPRRQPAPTSSTALQRAPGALLTPSACSSSRTQRGGARQHARRPPGQPAGAGERSAGAGGGPGGGPRRLHVRLRPVPPRPTHQGHAGVCGRGKQGLRGEGWGLQAPGRRWCPVWRQLAVAGCKATSAQPCCALCRLQHFTQERSETERLRLGCLLCSQALWYTSTFPPTRPLFPLRLPRLPQLLARQRIPSGQYADPLSHIFDEFDKDRRWALPAAGARFTNVLPSPRAFKFVAGSRGRHARGVGLLPDISARCGASTAARQLGNVLGHASEALATPNTLTHVLPHTCGRPTAR